VDEPNPLLVGTTNPINDTALSVAGDKTGEEKE